MKKQVKKFMSALLACVMVAVSVIVFDMNPVHAASSCGFWRNNRSIRLA